MGRGRTLSKLTEFEQKVLATVRDNPGLSRADIALKIGLGGDSSNRRLVNARSKLQYRGLIEVLDGCWYANDT